MATTLLDLPNEVLVEISQLLAKDTVSLLSLTSTCRRLSPMARDVLYEDIQLDSEKSREYHYSGIGPIAAFATICSNPAVTPAEPSTQELLLRAWREEPILLTQKLKAFAIHTAWRYDDFPQLLVALSRAKALKTLKIRECLVRDVEAVAVALRYPLWDHFPNLQSLDLDFDETGENLAWSALAFVFKHRALRTVRIGWYSCEETPRLDLPIPSSGSGLVDLDLSRLSCPSNLLTRILLATPQLQSLKISLPHDMVAFEHPYGARDDWTSEMWSAVEDMDLDPDEFGRSLWPVHQTLQSLSITSPRGLIMTHADTQIDLSAFRRLKDLQISSTLLIGDASYMVNVEKFDFIPLLPPNLVNLHICFDTLQGIFHSIEDLEQACTEPHAPEHLTHADLWHNDGPSAKWDVARNFHWVSKLANQCKNLERVELEETHEKSNLQRRRNGKTYIYQDDSFALFDVTAHHGRLFDHLPFQFKVSIYVDEDWLYRATHHQFKPKNLGDTKDARVA